MEKRLLSLLKKDAYQKKEVRLASGKLSDFYIDVRKVSLSSEGIYLISNLFYRHLTAKDIDAIGGPTLGADPIVSGVCFLAGEHNRALSGFLLRKTAKKHGARRLIEGPPLKKGSKVILCDDVATSGGSLIKAINIVKEEGLEVKEIMVVVDRDEGARQALAGEGCNLFSLYKKSDFLT